MVAYSTSQQDNQDSSLSKPSSFERIYCWRQSLYSTECSKRTRFDLQRGQVYQTFWQAKQARVSACFQINTYQFNFNNYYNITAVYLHVEPHHRGTTLNREIVTLNFVLLSLYQRIQSPTQRDTRNDFFLFFQLCVWALLDVDDDLSVSRVEEAIQMDQELVWWCQLRIWIQF